MSGMWSSESGAVAQLPLLEKLRQMRQLPVRLQIVSLLSQHHLPASADNRGMARSSSPETVAGSGVAAAREETLRNDEPTPRGAPPIEASERLVFTMLRP